METGKDPHLAAWQQAMESINDRSVHPLTGGIIRKNQNWRAGLNQLGWGSVW